MSSCKWVERLRIWHIACLVIFISNSEGAVKDCPPCGQVCVNMPPPAYDASLVQPVENYLAAYSPTYYSVANGFYIGTGFGYGAVNFGLKIAGISFSNSNNNTFSYVTENVSIGYMYSGPLFFLGVELAYNYRSPMSPIFYSDPSTQILIGELGDTGVILDTITVTPCNVRLDINSQNAGTLDLMPGFAITPRFVIFSRIGLEVTNYSWERHVCFPNVSVTLADQGVVQAIDQGFTDEVSDTALGFRLGVGVSYAAGRHVSFNLNYVHTFAENVTFTPNAAIINNIISNSPMISTTIANAFFVFNNINTLAANNTINPSRDEVTAGVRFTF